MFDREKVTEQNLKIVAGNIASERAYVNMLCIWDDPDCREYYTKPDGYARANFYRIVAYFVSIVEYLDRTEGASHENAFNYVVNVLDKEVRSGDIRSHVERCRSVSSGDDDFIITAAEEMEDNLDDREFVRWRIRLIEYSETMYGRILDFCREVLC